MDAVEELPRVDRKGLKLIERQVGWLFIAYMKAMVG
jgi:hypothetical protein